MDYQMPPMIAYIRQVLDEHTLPLDDKGTGLVEAGWLIDMVHTAEEHYRKNDS